MTTQPIHPDERLDAEDMAILLGVPLDEFKAHVDRVKVGDGPQSIPFPAQWIEQGRSRAEIYRQATGHADMKGALAFWRKAAK